MIKNIKEITIKELKAQFDHAGGYILISIFLGLLYFFFLKTFFISGVVTMKSMFQIMPWFLAIFVPAVTMGSFAGEKEKQTIEYLETKPIRQIDIILGKILGATKIVFIAILLTLPLPFFISRIAPIDIGETIAGYTGALILTFALASLGVAVSTFYKNQIAAFITTAVLILLLIIINSDITAINMPTSIVNALAQLSIVDNYQPIVRGVISLNNLIYFVIFTIISIAVAYANVEKIRISNTRQLYKRTFTIIISAVVVGIALAYVSNYFGQQIGRIDLTSSKKYTLSPITSEILRKEGGKIIIEVYASDNLPPLYQTAYSELKNILADYKSAGGNNIEVRYLNPKTNGERLSTFNIQPVQFNTVGEDQLKIQEGYLALGITNEDESKKEKIDYINSLDDMEYQITSLVNKIKSTEKPKVAFITGSEEKSVFTEYGLLQQVLQSEYDIQSVYLKPAKIDAADDKPLEDPKLSDYNLLVIAGPKDGYDEISMKYLNDYINAGGNVLYLGDTKDIDMNTGVVADVENAGQLLSQYGAKINNDMSYDLQSSLQIPVSQTVSAKYPFFIVASKDANGSSDIQFLPETILMPWTATLTLDPNWKWLYSTSNSGGAEVGNVDIDPKAQLSGENLMRLPLVAYRKTDSGGTLVVAGSSRIFEDQFTNSIQENAVLALALLENMGKVEGMSQIKAKNLLGSQFIGVEDDIKIMINYVAPLTSALLLALIGGSRVYRKKKLARIYA
jgi:ABC-2 type transport system permease protein